MKFAHPIAIVGIGGIFPGASSLQSFWHNVRDGRSASGEIPPGRMVIPISDAYSPLPPRPDRVYSRKGCLVEGFCLENYIDPGNLSLEPGLLQGLDPLFHLTLAAGVGAFQDAMTAGLDRKRTGVVLGNIALPTEKTSAISWEILGRTFEEKVLGRSLEDWGEGTNPLNRHSNALPAGLLARALGLGGGSFTLDAACASSLYAVKLAADQLLSGRADAMLCGGVSRPDCLYTQMGFSQLNALSPDGVCSPFDARGNGLVIGEGAGIVLMKRLEDALRDGDRIYGLIRGIGLSNDRDGNLLAPSAEGQLRAMKPAYAQSGWEPSLVDIIECHATGTPVGDEVEAGSLKALWGDEGWKAGQCVIGSVKSNIGHLLTGAGAAGLIKILLAMKEGVLPPTANFQSPAPGIRLDGSPFRVLQKAEPWERRNGDTPRRAGVSAFGFGGINAHILVEEWIPPEEGKTFAIPPPKKVAPVPVAVVGIDARLGPWKSMDEFRERALGGEDGTGPSPSTGWFGVEESGWFAGAFKGIPPFRGFGAGKIEVTPGRFRIPPKEMEEMLPQQLLMLLAAEGALMDAGCRDKDHARSGAFIGISFDFGTTNFHVRWAILERAKTWAREKYPRMTSAEVEEWAQSLRDSFGPALNANRTMGALGSIAASRIAREFRFAGPSFSISSEEASGLRALETAVRKLQMGEIDLALTGAVEMASDIRSLITAARLGSLPPGEPFGEGACALVLKRLEDARRDGDRIYCVITGIGASSGNPSPGSEAVRESVERACREAGTSPGQAGLAEIAGLKPGRDTEEIETPGTGGMDAFTGYAAGPLGHGGAATGLASLARACLCLYNEVIPPLARRGDDPGRKPQYWLRNRGEGPRKASVTGTGTDGSCIHVILEGYDAPRPAESLPDRAIAPKEGLFAVEGESVPRLIEGMERLKELAARSHEASIHRLAGQWHRQESGYGKKNRAIAFVSRDPSHLSSQVEWAGRFLRESPDKSINVSEKTLSPGFDADGIFYSAAPAGPTGSVAFVYPGSGSHYPGMGREAALFWPEVLRKQDGENLLLRDQMMPGHFWGAPAPGLDGNHNALIAGQVAMGTVITEILRGFGVSPSAAIGYSLGETASLFGLGAWKDRDGMIERLKKTDLFMQEMGGPCQAARRLWKMPPGQDVDWIVGVVDAPAPRVREALKDKDRAYLLIINTPGESVIGGDRAQVEKTVGALCCNFFPVQGVTAVHCPVTGQVKEKYRSFHLFPTEAPQGISFYSTAWGRRYDLTTDSAADAILAQAMDTLDFPRVIRAAYGDGVRIFVEIGPGTSCTRMIGRILEGMPYSARSACAPGQGEVSSILRLLAHLIAEGVPISLHSLYGREDAAIPPPSRQKAAPRPITVETGGKPFVINPPAGAKAPAPPPVPAVLRVEPAPARAAAIPRVQGEDRSPSRFLGFISKGFESAQLARAEAHEAYLSLSRSITGSISQNLAFQMSLVEKGGSGLQAIPAYSPPRLLEPAKADPPGLASSPPPSPAARPFMDRAKCMEFAVGAIGAVLGGRYSAIDGHPTRVRLPDEPLMLVDRIMAVEGEPLSLTTGRVITQHDVSPGAWYLDGGRIPTCIAVEAGQADLFLSGYLGIDLRTKGLAVYRLLDAEVTFHRPLPGPGSVIQYDIRIDNFFLQGDTYLFKFRFDSTVGGEPLLTMRNGCAGFFTAKDLAGGKGIVHTKLDTMPVPGKKPPRWEPPVPMQVESYSDEQVDALRKGDLPGCFGPAFSGLPVTNPLTIPGGRMKLVNRVLHLDPRGGRFGLGLVHAEADIQPEDWFLTCHFCDDNVMPGTLMYECCMHTLRIMLLRMGWVAGSDGAAWEPVPGVSSQLKCRGQVIDTTRRASYEVSIKEIGFAPEPYAIADALMYADGKPIVEIINMSIRLSGTTGEQIETMWRNKSAEELPAPDEPVPPPFDRDSILAFAVGRPSEAFGEPYRVFDRERVIARLPGPPYQFLDRITRIQAEPWKMTPGGKIEARYDVPPGEWYFASNGLDTMPFAVLLEVALQPCGWLAAYAGSALTSETDLSFRNLGGSAVQYREIGPGGGTLITRVGLTGVSSSGGMIIHHYDFDVFMGEERVYRGNTYFGFFSKEALANQVGIRDARLYVPSEEEAAMSGSFDFPAGAPCPGPMLRMIDRVEMFVPGGGPHGLGYVKGTLTVNPDAWYFKAHFYQDPVIPGSLGLESFFQLMRLFAVKKFGWEEGRPITGPVLGMKHQWLYRGQVIPGDKKVTVDMWINSVDERNRVIFAEGYLSVDGRIIYQMKDFSLRV